MRGKGEVGGEGEGEGEETKSRGGLMGKRVYGPCSITAPWRRLGSGQNTVQGGGRRIKLRKKRPLVLQTLLFNSEPNKGVPVSEA